MRVAVLIALALGATAVVQAGLNRRIAVEWGLAPTVFLNALTVLVLGALFHVLAVRGWFGASIADNAGITAWRWWWLIPGLCGFALVAGLPWVVARAGALQVYVGVVAAQMCASMIWDAWIEGMGFSWVRATGAAMVIAGVAFVAWRG